MASDERKRDYINTTYHLILRDGLDSITIRSVASEMGVTSGALYKHFDSLDVLLTYSSIRFLKDYARDARVLSRVELEPMQLAIQLWECMAYYGFRNVPVFEYLFFKQKSVHVRDIMFDYYRLFPEEIADVREYVATFMANDSLIERGFVVLSRAAELGMIDISDARYLSEVDAYLFQGMLAAYRDTYEQPGKAQEATKKYLELLVKNYNSQIKSGNPILTVNPLIERPQ
ncbi:MAG: TetR/AcrR family transcriptional regulator [Eggerthellaceae bacterium]|nr:TetR/AcrR family transcriptional regulator [Eggerthellaceae bacterium]